MRIVRTIVRVLLIVALVLFSVGNWRPVEVMIWDGLVLETKLAVLVIAAFLLGLVPMWAIHRAATWRMQRRLDAAGQSAIGMATAQHEASPGQPAHAP